MSRLEDDIAEREDVFQNSGKGSRATAASSDKELPWADFESRNTGPKGVLADYKIAKAREEQRMKEKAKQDHEFVEKGTMTVSTTADDEKRKMAEKVDEMDDDELDALVADIDAQFEADFASLRMKEMALSDTRTKNGVAAPAPIAAAKQGKQFRHLYEIKKDELVEFVENEDPNVLVFIHIYQLNLRACIRLSEIMATLCMMYPYMKWACMAEEGHRDFDDETLPILVVYKAGDVVQSYVRLVDDIGHNFDLDDVIDFLEERKHLKSSDAVEDGERDAH